MKTSADENNPIISVQYCTGYVDKQNQWRPGFNCSGQATKNSVNTTPLFCCGTSTNKYCCSTKQYISLGYAGGHNNDVTYGTLLTVVLSTFIFSVMLTIIAFVCCKKFWKSRENLNLDIVDDQLYRNTNFLTLNATQLINTYSANGLPMQTDAICSTTPTSSTNALPQQQAILSPSITNNNINNSLPAIVSSSINTYSPSNLYTSASTNNSGQPYSTINQQQQSTTINTQAINTTYSGQSSIAMTGYSMHHPSNVQALQQALIFYEPPPPYSNETTITELTIPNNSLPTTTTSTITNTNLNSSNIDLNTIQVIPNNNSNNSNQASVSYQQQQTNQQHQTNQQLDNVEHSSNTNDIPTNIWSQRLLLGLSHYRRDVIHPVLDNPRKKLCRRTLSQ